MHQLHQCRNDQSSAGAEPTAQLATEGCATPEGKVRYAMESIPPGAQHRETVASLIPAVAKSSLPAPRALNSPHLECYGGPEKGLKTKIAQTKATPCLCRKDRKQFLLRVNASIYRWALRELANHRLYDHSTQLTLRAKGYDLFRRKEKCRSVFTERHRTKEGIDTLTARTLSPPSATKTN